VHTSIEGRAASVLRFAVAGKNIRVIKSRRFASGFWTQKHFRNRRLTLQQEIPG